MLLAHRSSAVQDEKRQSSRYSLRDAVELGGSYQVHLFDKGFARLFGLFWLSWLDASSNLLGISRFLLTGS